MIKTIKHWLEAIEKYDEVKMERDNFAEEYKEDQETIRKMNLEFRKLTELLAFINREEELEIYWNTKRTQIIPRHNAREGTSMDLRQFFQKNDLLPKFKGTNDEVALNAFNWVRKNCDYKLDEGEQWLFAFESHKIYDGIDCEDGAILMANIMQNSGVPYWRIRLNMGEVKGGYHAWVTYLRESDDQWIVLDWCYWPRKCASMNYLWKDAEEYFRIDMSCNSEYGFGRGTKLDRN